MERSTLSGPAQKTTLPPTSSSAQSQSQSPNPTSSPTMSEPETPYVRASTSNRFWDKNSAPTTDGATGIDLASDSSDDDDDSAAAHPKKLDQLDSKIKRLLILETGPVRLKAFETNAAVREYTSLLDAFTVNAKKGKKQRMKDMQALLEFLQEHGDVVKLYNQYAKVDRKLRKDRKLPEFEVVEEEEDNDEESKENDVRRAPAKNKRKAKDEKEDISDEEGLVRQTVKFGEDFDGRSVFNPKGLTRRSLFSGKRRSDGEESGRELKLHRRDGPLNKDDKDGDAHLHGLDDEDRGEEHTPTRPSKKRKLE